MALSGDRVQAFIQRHRYGLLALYSVAFLSAVGLIAARRTFWYDESFTLLIASLPDLGAIWQALARGAENQPPLNFWLVHAALPLAGTLELSARLPAIVTFWLMTLCLYRIVARETNATHGLIALLIPVAGPSVYFAYEARAYGPLMLFAAASVLFWQMARAREHRPWSVVLFGVALTLSVYVHYYGVLVYLPFVVAELAAGVWKKQWDRAIWIAIVVSGVAVLPLVPVVLAAGEYVTMFDDPSLASVHLVYGRLLGIPAVLFVAMALLAGLLPSAVPPSEPRPGRRPAIATPAGTLLLFVFCLLPLAGWAMARFVTSAWADRYLLSTLVGFSVAFAMLTYERWRDRPWLAVGCLAALAAIAGLEVRQHLIRPTYRAGASVDVATAVRAARRLPDGAEPLLLPGMLYLPVYHYSAPKVRDRLRFLEEDPDDHFTVAARRLAVIEALPIMPVERLAERQQRFYVYRPSSRLLAKLKVLSMQAVQVDNDWYHVMEKGPG